MNKESISVQDELRQISPLILEINKDRKAEVPENYFQNVEEQILSQLQLPISKNTLVKVPEGYFKNLDDEVIKKVSHIGNGSKSNRKIFKLIVGAAIAACLGVFLISRLSFNESNNTNIDVVYETEDLLEALPNEIDDISIDQMIDHGVIEEDDLVFAIGDETFMEVPEEPFLDTDAPF